jgi:hypothetical protein
MPKVCTAIQRRWRGHRDFDIVQRLLAARKIQRVARMVAAKAKVKKVRAVRRIQRVYRGHQVRSTPSLLLTASQERKYAEAYKIRVVRGRSAVQIQRVWKGKMARIYVEVARFLAVAS